MKPAIAALFLLAACAASPAPPPAPVIPAAAVSVGAIPVPGVRQPVPDARLRVIERRELQDALDRAKARLREFDEEDLGL